MQLDASTPEEVPTGQQEQACEAEGCNFDKAAELDVFNPVTVAFEEEANALGRLKHNRTRAFRRVLWLLMT